MTQPDDVAKYLAAHPDFFDQHPELLEHLNVPHEAGSAAISLVERQVKLLREKQAASRERLAELVRVARSNESLAERIHALCLRLLASRSLGDIETQIVVSMRDDFDVTPARLFLVSVETASVMREAMNLLSANTPRCGHFSDAQRTLFFGDAGAQLHSMALVPIGAGASLGMLALGSHDAERFPPGVSTDFLARIGELITAAVRRCSMPPAA